MPTYLRSIDQPLHEYPIGRSNSFEEEHFEHQKSSSGPEKDILENKMNFGSFFRNVSVDKQSENSGGGGGLFGAPSKLFESINAKTESIVSDLTQKVDIGGKIDTLKRYSNIDKIGQSVLGTTFQSKPTDEARSDKSQTVPDQTKRDSVSQPRSSQPFRSMQFGDEMSNVKTQVAPLSYENLPFEQPLTQDKPSLVQEGEKIGARAGSINLSQISSTFSETSATQSQYQDNSNQVIPPSDTPSYEYHPTRGYSFQNQQSLNRNTFENQQSQDKPTTDYFKESIEKNDFPNASSKQSSFEGEFEVNDEFKSRKMPLKDSFSSERDSLYKTDDCKSSLLKESPIEGHLERKDSPPTWLNQSKDSFSDDIESLRKSSVEHSVQPKQPFSSVDQTTWPSSPTNSYSVEGSSLNKNDSRPLAFEAIKEENRIENPFNKGMSLDAFSDKKESSFKRQNTTPGPKPPRPPPPRPRSGSQSFQSSRSISLEEDPVKSSAPTVTREKPSVLEEVAKEPEILRKKKSFGSQSSNEEIGYLTRLQCQEIVSAVDDMIAGAIEETDGLMSSKPALFKEPSLTKDFWDYSVSKEPEYQQTQSYPNPTYGKDGYYVTEPDDSRNRDYESGNTMASNYRLSYEEEKFEENFPYEAQNREGERDRSGPNVDDYYTKCDSHKRNSFDDKEVEEAYPSISKEVEFQEPAVQTEDQLKSFMMEYVRILVTGDEGQLKNKNEPFKEHLFTPEGREQFSKAIELEGACSGGLLDESGLRAVLSRVVFLLTECQKTEDFVPAKRLLTTSLIYHIIGTLESPFVNPLKAGEKVFLFSYIKGQPIWHSLRFWNACFFQSVQETRAKMIEQMNLDAVGQVSTFGSSVGAHPAPLIDSSDFESNGEEGGVLWPPASHPPIASTTIRSRHNSVNFSAKDDKIAFSLKDSVLTLHNAIRNKARNAKRSERRKRHNSFTASSITMNEMQGSSQQHHDSETNVTDMTRLTQKQRRKIRRKQKHPLKAGEKVFLFSYIKGQPIWHSLRFWNACFFQSVQETRAKMIEQMKSDMEIEQAIINQINWEKKIELNRQIGNEFIAISRSYLNTMQVFNLHVTMRQEFLRKQGDLFNLSPGKQAINARSILCPF
ncbi:unnamed protein product [Rodentolepis nana]|uniref:J domain-containing protein n=1 Tax=Rodentolepis nana TaxID=102285 RepID=A0A0R3TSG5_RODNA|nr:unnamed protein product [Rodentolepis nana]